MSEHEPFSTGPRDMESSPRYYAPCILCREEFQWRGGWPVFSRVCSVCCWAVGELLKGGARA